MKRPPGPPPTVVLMVELIDFPGAPADLLPAPEKLGPAPWVLTGDLPKLGLPEIKFEQAAKPAGEFPGGRLRGFFPPLFTPVLNMEVLILGLYRARIDVGDLNTDEDGQPDIITGVPND